MKINELLIIHGKHYKNMTKKLLIKAKLNNHIPNKKCCIGIKPNLVIPSKASFGATTHPEIIAGIIEYLQENEYNNILILEGSCIEYSTIESFKYCGYYKLAKKYNIKLLNTQINDYKYFYYKNIKIKAYSKIKNIDFIINVPVLKGHCQTKITCALKNMKGLINNKEKKFFHFLDLHTLIAYLNIIFKQNFVIVDNICGDLNFEDGGNPIIMNRIFTIIDPVLCDAYVCNMLNYNINDIPYIKIAENLRIGSSDITKIICKKYNYNKLFYSNYYKFINNNFINFNDIINEIESCSFCYCNLISALNILNNKKKIKKIETKICIGQGFKNKTGKIGIGTCTKHFFKSLIGCPPSIKHIYIFICNYIVNKK